MTDFILIIVTAGLASVGGVKIERMPGPQCLGVLESLKPLYGDLGAACISPEGHVTELTRK